LYVNLARVEALWSSVLILELSCVQYKLQGGILSFVVSSVHCQLLAYMLVDTRQKWHNCVLWVVFDAK